MLVAYMAVEKRKGDEDPWTQARAAARDDVQAVLAPRVRRCPSCGRSSTAAAATAPAVAPI